MCSILLCLILEMRPEMRLEMKTCLWFTGGETVQA